MYVYVCVYVCVCMCVCVIQNVRAVLSKGTSLCREQCARVNESRAQTLKTFLLEKASHS